MGRLSLPVLHGPRLRLEPVGEAHLPLLVELNSDPEVMRYQLGRPATADETRAEWATRLGPQSDVARGLGYWAGYVDDWFLGWWSASAFSSDPTLSGIGYRLQRTAWGQGYATEGARLMVAQAFAAPLVERVVASTMAANVRSRAVLEKLGMAHTHSWTEAPHEPVPGSEQGKVRYDLVRPPSS